MSLSSDGKLVFVEVGTWERRLWTSWRNGGEAGGSETRPAALELCAPGDAERSTINKSRLKEQGGARRMRRRLALKKSEAVLSN